MPNEKFSPSTSTDVFSSRTFQDQAWLKKNLEAIDALQRQADQQSQVSIDQQRALQGLTILGSVSALFAQQRQNLPQISNDYVDRTVTLGPPFRYYEYPTQQQLALPAAKTYPYDTGDIELDRFVERQYEKINNGNITYEEFQQRINNKRLEIGIERTNGKYSPLTEQEYQRSQAVDFKQYEGVFNSRKKEIVKEYDEIKSRYASGEIDLETFNNSEIKRRYEEFFKEDIAARNNRRLEELQKIERAKQNAIDAEARSRREAREAEVARNKQLFGPWWEKDGEIKKLPAAQGVEAFESPWSKKGLTYEQYQQEQRDRAVQQEQNRQERLRADASKREREAASKFRTQEFNDYLSQEFSKQNTIALEKAAKELGITPQELQEIKNLKGEINQEYWESRKTLLEFKEELKIRKNQLDGERIRQENLDYQKSVDAYKYSKQMIPELQAYTDWQERVNRGEIYNPNNLDEFDDFLRRANQDRRSADSATRGQAFQYDLFGNGNVVGNPTPKSNPKPANGPSPQGSYFDRPSSGSSTTEAPRRTPRPGNGPGFGSEAIPVKELERPTANRSPGWSTASSGEIVPAPRGQMVSKTRKLENAENYKGDTIDITPNRNGTPNNKQGNRTLLPSDGSSDRGAILPSTGPRDIPRGRPINLQQPRNLKRGSAADVVGIVNDGLATYDAYKSVQEWEAYKSSLAQKYRLTRQQLDDIIRAYTPRKNVFNPWQGLSKQQQTKGLGWEEGYDWRTDPLGYEQMVRANRRGMSPKAYRQQFGRQDNGDGDRGFGPMGPYQPTDRDIAPLTPQPINGGAGAGMDRFSRSLKKGLNGRGHGGQAPWDKPRNPLDNWKNPYTGMTPDEAEREFLKKNPWLDPHYLPPPDPDFKPNNDPNATGFSPVPGPFPLPDGNFPEQPSNRMKVPYKWVFEVNRTGGEFAFPYFDTVEVISNIPPALKYKRESLDEFLSTFEPQSVGLYPPLNFDDFSCITQMYESGSLIRQAPGVKGLARFPDRSMPPTGDPFLAYRTDSEFHEKYITKVTGPFLVEEQEIQVPANTPSGYPAGYNPPLPGTPNEPLPQLPSAPQSQPDRPAPGDKPQPPKKPQRDPGAPNQPHTTNPPRPFPKPQPPPKPLPKPDPSPTEDRPRNPSLTPAPTPPPKPEPKPPRRRYEGPTREIDRNPPPRGDSPPKISRSQWTFTTTTPDLFPAPQPAPKPEEDPDMPCRYATDTQVPTPIQYFDPVTKTRKVQTFMIHEGLDEAIAFLAGQIADAKESTHKISSALEADLYYQPTGKPLVPNVQAEVMGTAMFGGAGLVAAKSLPMEMNAWASLNHMLAGHHQLGKTEFPKDMMNPAGAKTKPTTALGFNHWAFNQITNLIGLPNKHTVTNANGTTTAQSFKNQSDAIENVHAQNMGMEQDLEAIEKYLFKISQALEMVTQVVIQNKYDIDVLIDESGCKTKQKIVDRPGVFTHGKDDKNESFFERLMNKFTNKMVVREWNDNIDAKQLAKKTNMEAQVAAMSNKFEFDKTDPKLPIVDRPKQNPKAQQDDEWQRYVNTSENPGTLRQTPGLPVPNIQEIKLGTSKEVPKPTTNPDKLLGS